MEELCRYHAQVLYAVSDAFELGKGRKRIGLPADGVVPAGAVLKTHYISAYEVASATLLDCGFARKLEPYGATIALNMSSERLSLQPPPDHPYSNGSQLLDAFFTLFRLYDQSGVLGHPETLRRVIRLLPEAGLTEERFGFVEWSEWVMDRVRPPGRWGQRKEAVVNLWPVDALDCYVEEAADQWS